jgi:carbonyl reductase 1
LIENERSQDLDTTRRLSLSFASHRMRISSLHCILLLSFAILATFTDALTVTMRRILVTGGNKGIGLAVCERLLIEWKDTYVLLGSRDASRGQGAVQSILDKLGDQAKDRLQFFQIDTTSDESVQAAASSLKDTSLYAVINNAGIGWGHSLQDTINTNYFGPRRVNDAFLPLLQRPGGRIVNVASASGPNFTRDLPDGSELKGWMHKPWTIPGDTCAEKIVKLDELAKTIQADNSYGCSKALLNAYTVIHGKSCQDLIINSCSPGFIKTDLTAGSSAGKPPEQGAIPVCWTCMDESLEKLPRGRYYGSDCVRSPLHMYRDPGEPPYDDDEDLVELS